MKTIFKNPFLEFLTKTTFPIHLIWYTAISTSLFIIGSVATTTSITTKIALFGIGFLSWTLIEYIMHRFVFHFISENRFIQRFHHIFHGIHHDNPRDEKRTLMPPLPGLLFALIYLSIGWLLLGMIGFFVISGLVLGYLTYSGLHYAIHVYKAPKALQFLWTHHLLHHYQQPERAFGVTTRFWDKVFRTMPRQKNKRA